MDTPETTGKHEIEPTRLFDFGAFGPTPVQRLGFAASEAVHAIGETDRDHARHGVGGAEREAVLKSATAALVALGRLDREVRRATEAYSNLINAADEGRL